MPFLFTSSQPGFLQKRGSCMLLPKQSSGSSFSYGVVVKAETEKSFVNVTIVPSQNKQKLRLASRLLLMLFWHPKWLLERPIFAIKCIKGRPSSLQLAWYASSQSGLQDKVNVKLSILCHKNWQCRVELVLYDPVGGAECHSSQAVRKENAM